MDGYYLSRWIVGVGGMKMENRDAGCNVSTIVH